MSSATTLQWFRDAMILAPPAGGPRRRIRGPPGDRAAAGRTHAGRTEPATQPDAPGCPTRGGAVGIRAPRRRTTGHRHPYRALPSTAGLGTAGREVPGRSRRSASSGPRPDSTSSARSPPARGRVRSEGGVMDARRIAPATRTDARRRREQEPSPFARQHVAHRPSESSWGMITLLGYRQAGFAIHLSATFGRLAAAFPLGGAILVVGTLDDMIRKRRRRAGRRPGLGTRSLPCSARSSARPRA